ncbi:unnamed protein product [Adineta ricciae]|uniref:Tetratricopeptide repeat protein n=1 Tax=Adineta ricciae TaxID=249248 RepID=A0A815QNM0_ADIRI|nr:unnamed protein product [Adineta ricciae]
MGDYAKALQYYEKGLSIQQQSLPANHPDLATSYNNIGLVYDHMGDYAKALQYYEKATSYNNIGLVYGAMGDYAKGCIFLERGREIAKQPLPATHPQLSALERSVKHVKGKLCYWRRGSHGKMKLLKDIFGEICRMSFEDLI